MGRVVDADSILTAGNHPYSAEFLANIQGYNSSIALASMRAPGLCEDLANGEQGVYTFRIQGQLYHMVGPLEADEGEVPRMRVKSPSLPRFTLSTRPNRPGCGTPIFVGRLPLRCCQSYRP